MKRWVSKREEGEGELVRYKNIKQGRAGHNCSQIQLILKINTAFIYQIYMSDW